MEIRLQKILSAAGAASRRASERLIQDGRVTVNGRTVQELGTKADPARDDIRVDGRRIETAGERRYVLLYKPVGVVTTRSDPQGRRTVLSLLPGIREYLYPVGRLDYDSEGILLLTNDGELAARLTHPRHEVPKVYRARVRGVPDAQALERLARGIPLDGRRTAPAQARVVKRFDTPRGTDAILELTLREGRNRQVRRMCEAVGHPVQSLARVQFGPLRDARLGPGEARELQAREVAALRAAAGLVPETPTASPPRPRPARSGRDATRPRPPRRDRPRRG
jgi:pseudouridine synthase